MKRLKDKVVIVTGRLTETMTDLSFITA